MSDQTVGLFLYLRTDWRGLNEKEWERRHRSPPSSAPHTGIIESSKRFFGSRDELAGIFKVCKPLTHAVVGESIRVFVSTENDRDAPDCRVESHTQKDGKFWIPSHIFEPNRQLNTPQEEISRANQDATRFECGTISISVPHSPKLDIFAPIPSYLHPLRPVFARLSSRNGCHYLRFFRRRGTPHLRGQDRGSPRSRGRPRLREACLRGDPGLR